MINRTISFAFERANPSDEVSRDVLTLDDRHDTRTPRLFRERRGEPSMRGNDDYPSRNLISAR